MAKFTVDTHLFRELGELLVGRDSTALVELIKNSYDADATEIVVYGEDLDDAKRGFITISDNGNGMTEEEFTNGFLRIASRFKDEGPRLSKRYRRRFTGAKGIGRLAAHKLARLIQIHSVPWEDRPTSERTVIDAVIDWDAIEKYQTLDQLQNDAIQTEKATISKNAKSGTLIELEHLRRRWTPTEQARFLTEVETFEPPSALVSLPKGVLNRVLLFEKPKVQDSSTNDPGFKMRFEGGFAVGEDYWQNLAQTANWVVEIDARKEKQGKGIVEYRIAPTIRTAKENPKAETNEYRIDHPEPEEGPFFQARILIREGQLTGSSQLKQWAGRSSGVRVFMEGFRVLPYGEPQNDWLEIDADYTRRSRTLRFLEDGAFDEYFQNKVDDSDEALVFLRNNSYFGAVFLTQSNAPSLRMLVNREGFVPEAGFHTLVDLVRKGIDLSVRVRAAAKFESRERRSEQRALSRAEKSDGQSPVSFIASRQVLEETITRAKSLAGEARQLVARGDFQTATLKLTDAITEIERTAQEQDKLISEGAMLRVLASVGTQMAGFIHEINMLIGMADAVDGTMGRIREDKSLPREVKQELAKLHSAIGDLRRSLERQASYLVDVVTPDARRRRMRMKLSERFNAAIKLVEHSASRKAISIVNEIPPDIKSPPMFPAELTTVFSNLLTNAVKAAGLDGIIRATANQNDDGSIGLIVENTGVAVDLKDAERWFKPFESTTESVDPILGQGMGMGLPITRSMLEEYGATIRFTRPSKGFSTAVQISFPA